MIDVHVAELRERTAERPSRGSRNSTLKSPRALLAYRLKMPSLDGTTAIVRSPLHLLERLSSSRVAARECREALSEAPDGSLASRQFLPDLLPLGSTEPCRAGAAPFGGLGEHRGDVGFEDADRAEHAGRPELFLLD